MPMLALTCLGSFQTKIDTQPVTGYRSAKVQALLAYLAVEQQRAHPRDALFGLLWPDQPQDAAATNLRQSLSRLQKAIHNTAASPPYLLITRNSVQFNPASTHTLDVTRFQALLCACPQHSAAPVVGCAICAEKHKTAITLYQGDFLAHFFCDSPAFDTWVATQREALHQKALSALGYLADDAEQRGDLGVAQGYAQRQLELEPWREAAHHQIIRLLARQGEQSAALAHYERCRQVLATELGIEPSPALQALYAQLTATHSQDAAEKRPHNLPPLLASFWGRSEELAQIQQYLVDPQRRLLTLVGAGGVGKTRLALQAAHLADHEGVGPFRHGVYFASLVGVNTAGFVVSALANALGLTFAGQEDPEKQLLAHLRSRQLLLVLDNFEHLVAAAAPLVTTILQAAPSVYLLVTSRERLNLAEEWVLALAGLPFPVLTSPQNGHVSVPFLALDVTEEYSAVQLFLARAQQAEAHFGRHADLAQTAAIHRICGLLEGIPLGIEMAAAWVHLLSCSEIADEIAKNLDFLTSPHRNAPARHRSMRAVFEHSWRLLTGPEQDVMAALSVFQGGFTREAATHVAEASLLTLRSLVDKSLLKVSAGRYELHELLRQFAEEKLQGDGAAERTVRERHAQYYGVFLQQGNKYWESSDEPKIIGQMHAEIQNIRAGWHWVATSEDLASLETYLQPLLNFYFVVNWFQEGQDAFELAVTHLTATLMTGEMMSQKASYTLAKLCLLQAAFQHRLGQLESALVLLEKSLAIFRQYQDHVEVSYVSYAYDVLGRIQRERGLYIEAQRHLQQSVALAQKTQDRRRQANSCLHLGEVAFILGDYTEAQSWYQKSLAIYRSVKAEWGAGHALLGLGITSQALGLYTNAQCYYQQSFTLFKGSGDQSSVALAGSRLGLLAQATQAYAQAEQWYCESLELYRTINERPGLARVLSYLGDLACEQGDYHTAQEYLHTALDMAVTLKATPLILRMLPSVASLLIGANVQPSDGPYYPIDIIFEQRARKALELLLLVTNHPATYHETRLRADSQLKYLMASSSPAITDTLFEGANDQNLATTITTFLANPQQLAQLLMDAKRVEEVGEFVLARR